MCNLKVALQVCETIINLSVTFQTRSCPIYEFGNTLLPVINTTLLVSKKYYDTKCLTVYFLRSRVYETIKKKQLFLENLISNFFKEPMNGYVSKINSILRS